MQWKERKREKRIYVYLYACWNSRSGSFISFVALFLKTLHALNVKFMHIYKPLVDEEAVGKLLCLYTQACIHAHIWRKKKKKVISVSTSLTYDWLCAGSYMYVCMHISLFHHISLSKWLAVALVACALLKKLASK